MDFDDGGAVFPAALCDEHQRPRLLHWGGAVFLFQPRHFAVCVEAQIGADEVADGLAIEIILAEFQSIPDEDLT